MQDLPDECWALVFSCLKSKADRDAAALTCRRWRSLQALSRHSLRFLEHTNLSKDQWPRLHLLLLQTLHSFPHISSIIIWGPVCDVHDSFPRVFLHNLPQLTFLNLTLSRAHLNDHLVQSLAANCPSLIHLHFWNSEISDAGESDIKGWGFRHGTCLIKIKVRVRDISSAGLAEGLQGATSLRELSLSHTQFEPRLSSINWECCKGLEVLNLKWSVSLDDVFLGNIVESCKNLRVLILSWGSYVTLDGWRAVALSGRKLEKLSVVGCEEFCGECLLTISQGCPNLRLLKISDDFAFGASLARFRVSRPAVEVELYNQD